MVNEMTTGFKSIGQKQDKMLEEIVQLRVSSAAIEEHLKTLNGAVSRHETNIRENREGIASLTKKLAYYAGGLAVLVLAIDILIKFI